MARVKGGLGAKKRHNRVLKLAKGYRGARSKQYRVAKQSVMRALTSSYSGRLESFHFALVFLGSERYFIVVVEIAAHHLLEVCHHILIFRS